MKRPFAKTAFYCSVFLLLAAPAKSQTMAEGNARAERPAPDTTEEFKPHGQLWGCAFGDFAFKGNSDVLNRGGSNQYTGMPVNTNLFQFRRIYLGYNYDISRHFSAEFTLSSENDYGAPFNTASGDLLANSKFAPFVKYANIRWKNLWKGSDLVIGAQNGPAYGKTGRDLQTPEEVWGYRSVERTISDLYGTPCYDFGTSLQGWFDKSGSFGYNLFVSNGTMARPETDMYKLFSGNVYAKFFNKRLIINLYQDYQRINWSPVSNSVAEVATTVTTTSASGNSVSTTTYAPPAPTGVHHDHNMTKLFIAWTDKKFTVGAEAFMTTLMGDVQAIGTDRRVYYRTTNATAVSVFARGRIYKDKLGFFARYDMFDPSGNLSQITGNAGFVSYSSLTAPYDPSTKQQFVTAGLDFTPIKNVHLMPNLWLNTYTSTLTSSEYNLNKAGGTGIKGTDAVWRLTFYYIYGK